MQDSSSSTVGYSQQYWQRKKGRNKSDTSNNQYIIISTHGTCKGGNQKPQRHTQLHSCASVGERGKKFMPFKISKVLSKRINYMHVQQAETEASGKWVKAAPRNRTCNNTTTTHHKRSTCKFSGSASECVCVCWCCCAISCKDVAEEAAIAAAATSSPQCLSISLSLQTCGNAA